MDWKENINTIKEIYPGHYRIILNYASNKFLELLLNDKYQYVWVSEHNPMHNKFFGWQSLNLPLSDPTVNKQVLARNINFDFVMPTTEFSEIFDKLGPGITLVQLNNLPKPHLDLSRIKSKTLYDLLLSECDYLFYFDVPSATDYGTLISPNKEWLQSLLDNDQINWDDLP